MRVRHAVANRTTLFAMPFNRKRPHDEIVDEETVEEVFDRNFTTQIALRLIEDGDIPAPAGRSKGDTAYVDAAVAGNGSNPTSSYETTWRPWQGTQLLRTCTESAPLVSYVAPTSSVQQGSCKRQRFVF